MERLLAMILGFPFEEDEKKKMNAVARLAERSQGEPELSSRLSKLTFLGGHTECGILRVIFYQFAPIPFYHSANRRKLGQSILISIMHILFVEDSLVFVC